MTNALVRKSLVRKELGDPADPVAKSLGTLTDTVKAFKTDVDAKLKTATDAVTDLGNRVGALEAKGNRGQDREERHSGTGAAIASVSPGQRFTDSAEFKRMLEQKTGRSGQVSLGMTLKAIVNYSTTEESGAYRTPESRLPGVMAAPQRALTFIEILPVMQVATDIVEHVTRSVFANNAGPQAGGSPTAHAEGVLKNESNITFSLTRTQVETYAHWLLASRQVLDDAPALQQYIQSELLHGLRLIIERDLLLGTGSAATLKGIVPQLAVGSYGTAASNADKVARARAQIDAQGYATTHVVMHPDVWSEILTSKDNDGGYLSGNFTNPAAQTLWGLPVVTTPAMTDQRILVGDFARGVVLAERMTATVELSREDDQNFRKNLVTLLSEWRGALITKDVNAFRLI